MENITNLMSVDVATNLSCEELQEEFGSPLPLPIHVANVVRYIQAVFYIIYFLLGVPLNLFVTLLILRYKKLQTVTFTLALQVCIGDMINAAIVFPTSAVNAIAGRYVFTGLCSTFGFLTFFLGLARFYLMFVFVLDRFCTIFLPFRYQRHRIKVVLPFSIGAWMLSLFVALVPVRGLLDCYTVLRNSWMCYPSAGCAYQRECFVYRWLSYIVSNVLGVVSLVMYLILFHKARKLRNRVAAAPLPEANCDAEDRAETARKLKQERKANFTFFLLFLALIGVSIPPTAFVLVGRIIIIISGTSVPTAYTVAELLVGSTISLLTIVDPIVIMRNQDFREAIVKLFRWNRTITS